MLLDHTAQTREEALAQLEKELSEVDHAKHAANDHLITRPDTLAHIQAVRDALGEAHKNAPVDHLLARHHIAQLNFDGIATKPDGHLKTKDDADSNKSIRYVLVPCAHHFDHALHSIPDQVCDGGGVRGAATSAFLKRVQETFLGETKVADKFDMFAGTSTGSFIAALFGTLRYDVDDVIEVYLKQGKVCLCLLHQLIPLAVQLADDHATIAP